MEPKFKTCADADCNNEFQLFKTTDKYCSWLCAKKNKKPINKVSKKQDKINKQYMDDRKIFLSLPENKYCFIEGCNRRANTVEHTMGRKGFADDISREKNIPLTLDQRYWKPCCIQHNLELEQNPDLSKKYQLSKIHGGKKN